MIHSVIFDLDGTLSDSAVLTQKAMQQVLPPLGVPVPGIPAIRDATGIANPEFYRVLFPSLPEGDIVRVSEAVEAAELDLLPALGEALLFPGCRAMLEALKGRGTPLHIASTGDTLHVQGLLTHLKIGDYFATVSCHRPDKTEMLAGITGGDPSGWLMVGDTAKDYEAARANGIPSAGVLFGYCRRQGSAFDHYLEAPADLLPLLDAL